MNILKMTKSHNEMCFIAAADSALDQNYFSEELLILGFSNQK